MGSAQTAGEEREERDRYEQTVRHIRGAPVDKKWYHGNISDQEAERRLRDGAEGKDNSYLVYDNTRRLGQYVLLVIRKEKFYRWNIMRRPSDGKYILGEDIPGAEGFPSVRKLIKCHRGSTGTPIKTNSGLTLTLSKSYVYCID